MPQWINYHHLYYFKTIATEGSVSKAAEKLRLGQPTLSAQLKQFEDNLGIKLFDRQHKKLILTEQGKIAFDYAKNIFKMGHEMFEVLHDRFQPQKTSLHIGALDTIPKQIVLQMVKASLKIGPCQIALSEGPSDFLLRELSAHKIDLMVSNFIPNSNSFKGIHYRVIAKNNVIIYGSEKYRSLRKNFPQSVSNIPFILPNYDSKLRYDFDHWSKNQNLKIDILIEAQDIAIKKLMAVNGMGLLPTASHSVTKMLVNGDLIPIGEMSGVYEELVLITGDRKMANPVAAKIFKTFEI